MTTTAQPTALDVAFEFVATKLAIVGLLETIAGTSPIAPEELVDNWALKSPVAFPMDAEYPDQFERSFAARLDDREEVIEIQMLEAIGGFFEAEVDRRLELRKKNERSLLMSR